MTDQAKKPNLLKQIPLVVVGVGGVVTLVGLSGKLPDRITPPTATSIPQECRMACPARASLDLGIVAGVQAGAMAYNETIKALEQPTPKGWWKPGFRSQYDYNTASRNAISLGQIMMAIGWVSMLRSSGQSNPTNKGGEPENPSEFSDRNGEPGNPPESGNGTGGQESLLSGLDGHDRGRYGR
jgi:hypothetical protein